MSIMSITSSYVTNKLVIDYFSLWWFHFTHSSSGTQSSAWIKEDKASPCSILSATVDICAVFQQHLDNLRPASRGRLMESCVTGVVSPIDLPDVLLKTILDYILHNRGRKHTQRHINMFQRGVLLTEVKIMPAALQHEQEGFYLITQACSALQQGLTGVFIHNQPTDLWGNGSFGRRLWTAASPWWAFLIGWGWW